MDNICQLNQVTKRFGENMVLNNFSLNVKPGEMLCIAGPSGSGKSTILNIIGMFENANEGCIYLFDNPQPKLNSKKGRYLLQTKIFYLFQNYALVDDKSVSYNLDIHFRESRPYRTSFPKNLSAFRRRTATGFHCEGISAFF